MYWDDINVVLTGQCGVHAKLSNNHVVGQLYPFEFQMDADHGP